MEEALRMKLRFFWIPLAGVPRLILYFSHDGLRWHPIECEDNPTQDDLIQRAAAMVDGKPPVIVRAK
jgi:hypothetical protein